MDEPDVDIKKEIILAKLDSALAMLEKMQEQYDLVGFVDIRTVLLQAEKEVKEY